MKKNTVIALFLLWSINAIGQAPLINGVFECSKSAYSAFGKIFYSNSSSAYFTSEATLNPDPNNGINVGKVKINSITLPLFNNKFYGDTTNKVELETQHWIIEGDNSIPNMNFTITQPFPEFELPSTSLSRLTEKDTLNKNDTLYINITDIQNTDSIRVNFSDGYENDSLANGQTDTTSRVYISLVFSPRLGGPLPIPPYFLQTLHTGEKAVISVQASNYTHQNIEGKNYLFRNSYIIGEADIYIKE
jgi:hypothetical protein